MSNTFADKTPFQLLKEGKSHQEIWKEQMRLMQQGQSLWDWASYKHLYKHVVPELKSVQTPVAKSEVKEIVPPPVVEPDFSQLAYVAYKNRDMENTVRKNLKLIPEKHAAVLTLLFAEKKSAKAASVALAMPLQTVYNYRKRGLEMLRALRT